MSDRTRTRLLNALKASGPQTAAGLAKGLEITAVAVRQHLDAMLGEELVEFEDLKGAVGRPKRIWSLSKMGHAQFPDNHAALLSGLLAGVTSLYGSDGLDRLIAYREEQSRKLYSDAVAAAGGLKDKVTALAQLRSREGYMAEVADTDDGYLLIENHCSICAAATVCHGFCRSELSLFRAVLGGGVDVEREEHLLSGGRRCVYRIKAVAA